MDDRTQRNIRRAADLIGQADALLITAGAGMGVDSGLPDFRGSAGFWRAYPALGKLKISFEQMAQPQWFRERPEMAWAFYGHRQQLYRETKPHMGYHMLHDWGRAMPAGYFVVTSNVDGQFEKAGFPSERVLEQHGNIHRLQCSRPCSELLWHEEADALAIDLETFTARGRLPQCPECGAVARPNVLMFADPDWLAAVRLEQEQRYRQWLASVRGRRLVVIELGAGTAVATIRSLGERLAAERDRVSLLRANPDVVDAEEPVIPIRLKALDALQRIEAELPERFQQTARSRMPSPGVEQQDRMRREDLRTLKKQKVYSKAWTLRLPSGEVAWVDQIHVKRNYLGWIDGVPGRRAVAAAMEEAVEFVRQNFHGPEPVVIPPTLFDPDSDEPILPPLLFAAQVRSWEEVNAQDEGSWINLVWFAEIDDDRSIKASVEDALQHVDWKTQASGYSA